MEDPGNEVADVVRALVKKPTFKQQAETIERYFTRDCTFFHVYINIARGHASLTALYQLGMFVANYEDVIIISVVYDPRTNCVGIRLTLFCNPWILLWRPLHLEIFTHCELEDSEEAKNPAKVIKKVKSQKDYFLREPLFQFIPVVGPIYDSDGVRFVVGEVVTQACRTVQSAYFKLVPQNVQGLVFSLWEKFLLVPPQEQFGTLGRWYQNVRSSKLQV